MSQFYHSFNKSFCFIVSYFLFKNTMSSVTKFNVIISGLFQVGSAYEWVVIKKSRRSLDGDLVSLVEKKPKHQRGAQQDIFKGARICFFSSNSFRKESTLCSGHPFLFLAISRGIIPAGRSRFNRQRA